MYFAKRFRTPNGTFRFGFSDSKSNVSTPLASSFSTFAGALGRREFKNSLCDNNRVSFFGVMACGAGMGSGSSAPPTASSFFVFSVPVPCAMSVPVAVTSGRG